MRRHLGCRKRIPGMPAQATCSFGSWTRPALKLGCHILSGLSDYMACPFHKDPLSRCIGNGSLAASITYLRSCDTAGAPFCSVTDAHHIKEGEVVLFNAEVGYLLPLLACGVNACGVVRTACGSDQRVAVCGQCGLPLHSFGCLPMKQACPSICTICRSHLASCALRP